MYVGDEDELDGRRLHHGDMHSSSIGGGDVDQQYGSGQVVVYTARRVVNNEKTFFQKYGTFAMLAAFFIFNIFIKSRQSSTAINRARTSVAATTRAGKGKATIEEIDGEIDTQDRKKTK